MIEGFVKHLREFHRDDAGKISVEVILLIAVIALPLVIVLIAFRDTINGWFVDKGNVVSQEGTKDLDKVK